jgi:hypothetical protein
VALLPGVGVAALAALLLFPFHALVIFSEHGLNLVIHDGLLIGR